MRREYIIWPIYVNEIFINRVVIDSHVDKHKDHIDDELILELVKELNFRDFVPETNRSPYLYFATTIQYKSFNYKMVWIIKEAEDRIGIITTYRDRRIK